MAEATAATDISAQDLQEWGEPSNEATVGALQALSSQILDIFKKERRGSGNLVVDAGSISELVLVIEREIPFFHQGAGVATLPRQIEHLTRLRPRFIDPVFGETRKEIMRGLDCKLPTVILGQALREIATLSGQTVDIGLTTRANSAHPSLIIETGELAFKVDFYNRFDSSHTKEPGQPILAPVVFRERTEGFALVKGLTKKEVAGYRNAPYIGHNLGAEGLRELDINFINS